MTQQHYGWDAVFVLMAAMIFVSCLPLLRSIRREIHEIISLSRLSKQMEQLMEEQASYEEEIADEGEHKCEEVNESPKKKGKYR